MKIRGIILEEEKEQEVLKLYENNKNNKVVLFTDKVSYEEDGVILLDKNCELHYDIMSFLFIDKISKITYNKEDNTFNFLDQYGYSVTIISSENKRLLVSYIDDHIVIDIVEEPKLYDKEYPIFSRSIEYIGDNLYSGKLYVQFSPITNKEKYILTEIKDDNRTIIESKFNIIERDTIENGLFNYLGLSVGQTLLVVNKKDNTVLDICMIYDFDNYNIKLISEAQSELVYISYMDIINNDMCSYNLILCGYNILVYNKSDDFIDKDIENKDEIVSELNEISKQDIESISTGKEILEDLINENSDKELDKDTKEELLVRVGIYISSYEKISTLSIFDNYIALIYIDEDNTLLFVEKSNLYLLKETIDKALEILK